MYIDLHTHLIPNVDDGAASSEESLELAKLGVKEGISHAVVTPHHRNGQYINPKSVVLKEVEKLRQEYYKAGINMKLQASQEIRVCENFMDYYYNDELLSLDVDGRYFLIEFPTAHIPNYALDLIKEMIQNHIIPVIAHPERNHVFAKNLSILASFIELGCLGQVTSSCLSGFYGDKLQRNSFQMIESHLVHVVASDVHHIKHRPFNMKEAYKTIGQKYGDEYLNYFTQNAIDILNGSLVNGKDIKLSKPKKRKWFIF